MKRFLIVTTAAIALGAFGPAGAALAQSATPATGPSGQATNQGQRLVTHAAGVVSQIKQDPHFAALLKDAKGVFIVPSLTKGAFIVGGQGGRGVLLKHNADGSWSDPAFVSLGSISIGAQAGGKSGPAAMLLMTTKALNDFTQANNFSLGANAGLTIVNYSANGQAPVGKGDIVIWSSQSGAFAGASVNGADVTQDSALNRSYYGKPVDARQIIDGQATTAGASALKSALAAA
jgi:lipid-binding SYLF domain-containing protein